MKFRNEIVIDADQQSVWAAFDDPENIKAWQPTLESFAQKSGERGQPGSVAELVYDENGRKVRLVETITERREPHCTATASARTRASPAGRNQTEGKGVEGRPR